MSELEDGWSAYSCGQCNRLSRENKILKDRLELLQSEVRKAIDRLTMAIDRLTNTGESLRYANINSAIK